MQQHTYRNHLAVWLLIGTAVITLVACGHVATSQAPAPTPPQPITNVAESRPTLTDTELRDGYADLSDREKWLQFQTRLDDPSVSADEKRLLATSISGIRGRTIERATAMTYPTALRPGDPGYTPPPTFPPVPTPTPGIFAAGVPQLFFDTYRVQNVWGGAEDDKRLTFWAGAGLKDPLQGLLVEAKAANDGTGSFDYSYYPTSNASGIIRIIGEQGTTLLLEAVNGDRFTFDRASRTYVGGVDSSQRRFDLQQGRFVSITGIGSAVIYIGTAPTNPTELLMLMLTKSENVPPQGAPLVVAPIPQRLGAIRSMRQNYAQLQIEGTNGETLVFDLNKQQFTTDTPIPTITPSPTETPLVLTPSP